VSTPQVRNQPIGTLRFDCGSFIVPRMARTPLARAVQDAAAAADADSRRTTRRTFVREAGVAAFGLTALGRFAASARASGEPRIVVVGAGLAGLTCAYRLRQAGYNVDLHEASSRAGGRCWTIRGAFAEGQIAEHGGEFIDTGHDAMRGLVRELGFRLDDLPRTEQSGTEVLGFFDGHPYSYAAMAADFKVAWPTLKRDVAEADYPTTYYQSTPRGRELDAMSIIDYLDEAIPGGSSSKLGQLLDVAYTIEYGADSAKQSSLNLLYLLGYSGPKLRIFGESDERFHVAGGNDQVPAALASELGNDIAYGSELVSVTKRSGGDFSLGFREDGRTRTVTADKVVLALPFAIIRRSVDISRAGFSNRKRTAIAEQGMGTNSKLHVQFDRRHWRDLGSNGETYSDTGYQNTWEVTRAQSGTAGILVDYTGGAIGASFGTGTPSSRAKQFLAQIEPVLPGITRRWNGRATIDYWPGYEWTRGSYAYWKVGQYIRFAGVESEQQGNCHFAGEHTSLDFQGYLNGAVESGERAAGEILADLG
jgi:monoamine oxidase